MISPTKEYLKSIKKSANQEDIFHVLMAKFGMTIDQAKKLSPEEINIMLSR